MKTLVSLLLCVMLLLPAAALAEDGWFAAAELSEEERNLLTVIMMDEMWGPYDFKSPEGATHLSLTILKLEDGQWTELHTETKALTPSNTTNELTITARLNNYGYWESNVQQNTSLADGRIYINPVDPPNTFGLIIWQPDPPDATSGNFNAVYIYEEEPINTTDMYWYQRVFLQPEKDGPYQKKAIAVLNEPVLLEIYTCFTWDNGHLPSFSEFNNLEAFAGLDYAFAVTAIFTDKPLE